MATAWGIVAGDRRRCRPRSAIARRQVQPGFGSPAELRNAPFHHVRVPAATSRNASTRRARAASPRAPAIQPASSRSDVGAAPLDSEASRDRAWPSPPRAASSTRARAPIPRARPLACGHVIPLSTQPLPSREVRRAARRATLRVRARRVPSQASRSRPRCHPSRRARRPAPASSARRRSATSRRTRRPLYQRTRRRSAFVFDAPRRLGALRGRVEAPASAPRLGASAWRRRARRAPLARGTAGRARRARRPRASPREGSRALACGAAFGARPRRARGRARTGPRGPRAAPHAERRHRAHAASAPCARRPGSSRRPRPPATHSLRPHRARAATRSSL